MATKTKLILIILLGLAIFVRFYNFPAWFGFDYDQEINAWIAKSIAIDHHPVLIGPETSTGGMYVGPFFNYLIAAFYAVGKMNPSSGIFLNLILSVMTISAVFFVCRKIFGTKSAVISSVIYAFSFNLTSFDRVLWNPTPIPLVSLLNLFFLWKYIQEGKKWQLIAALTTLGLMFHLHFTAVFVALFDFLALILFARKMFWNKIENYILSVPVLLPFFLPLIIFDLKHNFLNLTHLINFFFHSQTGAISFSAQSVLNLAIIIVQFTRAVISNDSNIFFDIAIAVTLILGFLIGAKNPKKILFIKLFLLEIVSLIIPMSFYKGTLPAHYFLFLLPVLIIVISNFFTRLFSGKIGKYGLVIIMIPFLYFNIVKSMTSMSGLSLKAKHDAVKFVVGDSGGKSFKVDFIFNPGLKTGFRYLFWLEHSELVENMSVKTDFKYKIIIPYYLVPEKDILTKFTGVGVIKSND